MSDHSKADTCSEKIFSELFRKHSEDLYKFLYYKFGSKNNPSDLVQEAFVKLWNNCKKVSPENARGFLFTVANNQMLNELSKKNTVLQYQKTVVMKTNPESPEYLMEENEFMEKLQNALEELSEAQRVAFLMNRVEGKKHKEIAEILGISQKAVEKRIYSALAALREKIDL